jgi:hypothetical protein
MSAAEDIRHKATLLGWSINTFPDGGDVLVRGDKYITTFYSKTGSVVSAQRRQFASLAGTHILLEQTGDKHKKERVTAWLAA